MSSITNPILQSWKLRFQEVETDALVCSWLVAEAGFESHFQNHFVKHEVILFYPHDNLEAGTRAVSILQEGNGLSKVEGPAQES